MLKSALHKLFCFAFGNGDVQVLDKLLVRTVKARSRCSLKGLDSFVLQVSTQYKPGVNEARILLFNLSTCYMKFV